MQAGLSPPSSPSSSTHALPSSPGAGMTSPRRPGRSIRGTSANPPIKRTKSSSSTSFLQSIQSSKEPFECPICCLDYPPDKVGVETLDLGCGHQFCRNCWGEYLVGKVLGEGESAKIQCMATGCSRVVKPEILDGLVTSDVSKK